MVVKWEDLLQTLTGINKLIEKVVTEGVVHGSQTKKLSLSDFTWKTAEGKSYEQTPSVTELLKDGMPILDALIYNSHYKNIVDHTTEKRPDDEKEHYTISSVTKYLFVWYFSIYSQAKSEFSGTPAFLSNSMAMKNVNSKYGKYLTTANIDNFPFDWVKNMPMPDLGEKVRNRLSLGAAGHRYVNALKFISEEDYKENTEAGQKFIRCILGWTGGKLWWDLHPSFRKSSLIQLFGSLNHMIEDCLNQCVKEEKLAQLAQEKILNHRPNTHLRARTWKDFNPLNLPELVDQIQ